MPRPKKGAQQTRQIRITLSDTEVKVCDAVARHQKQSLSEIALRTFRAGFPALMEELLLLKKIESSLELDGELPELPEDNPGYESLPELIMDNWDRLSRTKLNNRLIFLRDGGKPEENDLLRIALYLGLSEEYVTKLKEQKNGCNGESHIG